MISASEALAFGSGRAQETIQEVTEFAHDVRDFYHSATHYYYGNTHIQLHPSLSNPSVSIRYQFRRAPVRVTVIHPKTKQVLGVRNFPVQEFALKSLAEVVGDKRIDEKVRAQFRSEIQPLQDQVMAEVKKVAIELQNSVKQGKLTEAAATAQFKDRFSQLVKKAAGKYSNVMIR